MEVEKRLSVDGCEVAISGAANDGCLIDRCLPALTELENYGVTTLELTVRRIPGDDPEWWLKWPRFYDGIRLTRRATQPVINALCVLDREIEAAIESAIAGGDLEEQGFLAAVSIRRRNDAAAWEICCEITALISEDWPGIMIELN